MLIEFKTKNFYSFKEEISFLMTRVNSFKEHLETNIIRTQRDDIELLKTAAIYGANGSGKSNFLGGIAHMSSIIYNSFSDSLKKEEEINFENFNFKLNTETEKANTMFEVSFLEGSTIFRYGFETIDRIIKKEWLYKKVDREVLLFSREGEKFQINKESFSEGEQFKKTVNKNVLFISHLAQNNQKIASTVFRWFANLNVLSGIHDANYDKFTAKLLKSDPKFKKWASLMLKYLEISNIEAGENEGEVRTFHNRYDENNILVDSVQFTKYMESDGTLKLIHSLGPIYDTLKLGRVLFIDEFDSKLHPNLTKKLIKLFHDFNRSNAQLVFSAQDASLMDKDIFRRDQIWFTEKDQFGASSLFSLSEFDSNTVRNTSAFNKKYLANEFGAADTIELNNKIMDVLYE
jgi:AAA15 family ATPase/GTPase